MLPIIFLILFCIWCEDLAWKKIITLWLYWNGTNRHIREFIRTWCPFFYYSHLCWIKTEGWEKSCPCSLLTSPLPEQPQSEYNLLRITSDGKCSIALTVMNRSLDYGWYHSEVVVQGDMKSLTASSWHLYSAHNKGTLTST